MRRAAWEKRIKEQIKIDAEFIPSFATTISILAEILEERDNVYAAYKEDGARPVITFTSDRGAENPKQNPLLRQWQELNTTALAYLRDLGLTAAGLRKLQGQLPEKKKSSGFSKLEAFRARRYEQADDDDDFDFFEIHEPEPYKNDFQKAEEMGITIEEYNRRKVEEYNARDKRKDEAKNDR